MRLPGSEDQAATAPGTMAERASSRTALATAYLRGAHQILDAAPRILEDPVALPLLGAGAEARIRGDLSAYEDPARRGLRAHVVLRSRYAEDRLAAALERGIGQYVLLGAGFDTFALRQPAWARALRIVEVDHAGTQAEKRRRIAEAGLAVPANVIFASVDFARESLLDGLARHGVTTAVPTFFSWLGVTVYLEESAIDATLASVAAFPAGSELVLTFASSANSPFAERAALAGEPWLSRFEPAALEAKLRSAGYAEVAFLAPEEAEARYFGSRPQDLPVPGRTSIVAAVR